MPDVSRRIQETEAKPQIEKADERFHRGRLNQGPESTIISGQSA